MGWQRLRKVIVEKSYSLFDSVFTRKNVKRLSNRKKQVVEEKMESIKLIIKTLKVLPRD